MNGQTPLINGALLRMRREELGWALADLATRACLSSKQVKQIEEGGTSSFYSETVKVTAAKKVGGILGLPEPSVFVLDEPEVLHEEVASPGDTPFHSSEEAHATSSTSSTSSSDQPHAEETESTGHDTSVASPDIASPAAKPYLKTPSIETTVIQKSTNSALDNEDKPKPKNSLWYIIALFVAALGLAAVMQQPPATPPAEPPPPIQVLPADQADPAASAPTDAASGVAPVAPVVIPAASSATATPPTTSTTAPVVRPAAPAVATTPATTSSTPPASQ
jgi:cytoskeleton protein RodZ